MKRHTPAPLALVAALAGLAALAGCDGNPPARDAGRPDAGRRDAGTDAGPPGYDGGPVTRVPESEAAEGRASCRFGPGAWPWETVGEEHPIGEAIPIDHFLVVMQENRSFDHYFGAMAGRDGYPEVEGPPPGTSNPDASGTPVELFHATEYCIDDVRHSWNASHREWNGGTNDGFVVANDPAGERAMGYLDDTDLPFYWDLIRSFASSDHHHCSVLGPTWVNRFYSTSGTSFGLIRNSPLPTARVPEDEHHIFQQLDRAGISWGVYHQGAPFLFGGYPHYGLTARVRENFIHEIDEFYEDLSAGTLPRVVFIDPEWDFRAGVEANDEHPPANPQLGQAYLRDLITALMASPIWPRSALILTYDEHGGFYDHVPPPEACPPGDLPPDLQDGDVEGGFDRLGFRVPLIVVSPYSRPGYVSDRVTDHASVLRLLQARFLLPAMTGRDANAWPLLDLFDFDAPPRLEPPALADAPIDETRQTACRAAFPEK